MRTLLFIFLNITVTLHVFSQWNSNAAINNLVVNTPEADYEPLCLTDGIYGSIIIFRTAVNGDYNIYAQKISAAGDIAWGSSTSPVAICDTVGEQYSFNAVADGAGGAFVAWEDYRNEADNEIYIQRISSAGAVLWAGNGIRVTQTDDIDESTVVLCADGNGGVILAWDGDNNTNNIQVYVQRYGSDGAAQWQQNGVQACTALGFRNTCGIVKDGSGGAIMFFNDSRDDINSTIYGTSKWTDQNIYAQRLSSIGTPLWGNNGVAVCKAAGNQDGYTYRYNTVISDGNGGAFIAFEDTRNDGPNFYSTDIYAQKLNNNGIFQWTANGVKITTAAGSQFINTAISDESGGIIVGWTDASDSHVYTQKINGSGLPSWTDNGITVSPVLSQSTNPVVVPDGAGNYIYCFVNYVSGVQGICAQKIDPAGGLQWGINGVAVHNFPYPSPQYPSIVFSGDQSVIISWNETRDDTTTGSDIFASKVLSNGDLAGISPLDFYSIANGNWNDPGTWLGGIIPSSTANVIIRNSVTVTANTTCHSLRLELPAGNLVVMTGSNLIVTH